MVDADAVVLLPSARLVVPKGVRPRTVISGAKRVSQSEVIKRAELPARAGEKQRVVHPAVGKARIELGRNDVEISPQDQRFFQLQAFARVMNKSVHPADL